MSIEILEDQDQITELLLDTGVPTSFLSERKQAGTKMIYVEGHYVIRRLNEVFGAGNWNSVIRVIEPVASFTYEKIINAETKDSITMNDVTYKCEMTLEVIFPSGKKKVVCDVGFGRGIGKNVGDCHESAGKEARTDALKRCAKDLGDTFGLHTYDGGSKTIPATVASYKKALTLNGVLKSEAQFAVLRKLLSNFNAERQKEIVASLKANYRADGTEGNLVLEYVNELVVEERDNPSSK